MSVNGIGSNFFTDQSNEIVKKGKGKDKLLRDDFMLMLVEQIKNQDPLNPMENTEFTTQLAQFSTLEGISNMNSTMETLLLMQSSLNNAAAIDLVGKKVEIEGNIFNLSDKGSEIIYSLPEDADYAEINIKNAEGLSVVKIIDKKPSKGIHNVTWDGKDMSGARQKNGSYSFDVKAVGINGEEIDSRELTVGEVTNLKFEPSGTYLLVNSSKVPVSNILGVRK